MKKVSTTAAAPRTETPVEPTVRLTLDRPKSLHKRLTHGALERDPTITDVVRTLLAKKSVTGRRNAHPGASCRALRQRRGGRAVLTWFAFSYALWAPFLPKRARTRYLRIRREGNVIHLLDLQKQFHQGIR